ncbi:2-hydroxychromene-2-carboxylate isomerase [Roseomonas sp. BN140053]|uniref:2-hydroxychromene-2-carboxylate isomerase n=1 Tax=Roseomonas sp. BN140053 TaxID=3391898 RepID=UPI0039E9F07C
MTERAPVEFFFDFISPFGFLASLRVDALAAAHGREARWQSMLLGVSVLKVMGMQPLPKTPLKGPYLRRDLGRYLRRHGLYLGRDLDRPPANPIPAGRAFHALDARSPELARRVARALLQAYWIEDRDIGDPAIVAAVAGDAGAEAAAVLDAIGSGEGDRLLRAAVDASLNKGVFGSPFFLVDGEPFFGLEKMELLAEWLDSGGW